MTRPTWQEMARTRQAMADALEAELDDKATRRAQKRGADLDRETGEHLTRTTPPKETEK